MESFAAAKLRIGWLPIGPLPLAMQPFYASVENIKLAKFGMAMLRVSTGSCASFQLPSVEEIEALLKGRRLTCIVFFLDETFEELSFNITTTVLEAVEQLAGIIKLQNYSTFTLFECRKSPGPRGPDDVMADEHMMLDDNRYIADILFEFKNSKAAREGFQSKMLLKKRMFR